MNMQERAMQLNQEQAAQAAVCQHDWEDIGETAFSGDKWTQWATVSYCKNCKRYAAKRHTFLDFAARQTPEEVQEVQRAEKEQREKLIADHKAKVGAS
jgi:hypothetical protein